MTKLDKVLKEGEIVIWRGKPEKYKILDKTNGPAFFKRCLINIAICAAVELSYVGLVYHLSAEILMWIIIGIFVVFAASPILFLIRSIRLKKCIYAATNYRLITVADKVISVTYNRIYEYCFKIDRDGHTSLLCGTEGLLAEPGKRRELAILGNPDDPGAGPCEKFAFYAITTPDELRRVLSEKIRNVKNKQNS